LLSKEKHQNAPIEPKTRKAAQGRKRANTSQLPRMLGGLEDVRTYGHKAERAAALIYAHFKKEFGFPFKQ
jgi:hypothetical protein